jgi:hypothetical protein
MKGAFIVSGDPDIFTQVTELLLPLGGQVTPDEVVQVTDERGESFTVFGNLGEAFAADLGAGVDGTRGDVPVTPELSATTCCWAECRSEESFVRWVKVIASGRAGETWVLDGDGILWTPDALDPTALRL